MRVPRCNVLLDVGEDVLLTFISLKALMNRSHLPLVHVNQQHVLWENVFKNTGNFFFKGGLKRGVVSHLLPQFCTEEVGHYRACVIFIKLLIIQADQPPSLFIHPFSKWKMVAVSLASKNICRWYLGFLTVFFLFEVRSASFAQGWINFLAWFFKVSFLVLVSLDLCFDF